MKRISLMILAFLFILGTIVAALPPAKAQAPGPVKMYVKDIAPMSPHPGDEIYPPKTPGGLFPWEVAVFIESPLSWYETPDGIISFQISLRVDPTVIEVVGAKSPPDRAGWGVSNGFLEVYAALHGLAALSPGYTVDKPTGTVFGYSLALSPIPTVGAGGNPVLQTNEMELMDFTVKSYTNTLPSVFDLMGPGQKCKGLWASAMYTNGKGETYEVPEVDLLDGYYIDYTPDKMYFDSMAETIPYPPTGSDWHELWPIWCQVWSLESFEDTNGDGAFSASDQIDMVQTEGGAQGTVIWGHVDWLNPAPVPNDGYTDLIITLKPPPVPEFPLGIGVLMAIVPLIPIVYIWRLRKKSR